ncbi:MAG: trimeric intracellular cation channel family protein [Deltaproteobacteria bacterium]|nr:trimeric intracellular cation channel family protein [Deltaproteobacteria bacterium]MBW2661560.1 trimeric intracellular cation channel family protein [Deltaproteobacteria bacterium]
MITFLDIFGTFVFAMSGAFRAVKYELDIFGVLVLSVATGVGGGIVRDLILGITPPAAFQDETYLLICFVGGLLVFIGSTRIASRWDSVMASDALGLSVFAAIGAAKASTCGLGAIGIIMMAAITATGGGIIRDMLVCKIPAVLNTDFYATAALLGGACFVVTRALGCNENIQLFCAIAATICIRIIAMKYGISLPRVKSLSASPSQLTQQRKIRVKLR